MKAEKVSMPLIWLAGERWPEAITREGEKVMIPDVIGGGYVTGTLKLANGRWFFNAEDFARPRWEL
jgi:hypothetical protein